MQWWLQVPIAGSTLLFLAGSCFYVFTVAALGIALGTVASTMAQFGLLSIPVLLVMMLLSGSTTLMESMPVWLQHLMNVISPTPHIVVFAQDVLYRGADLSIVWPEILATAVIGAVQFGFAALSFPPRHFQQQLRRAPRRPAPRLRQTGSNRGALRPQVAAKGIRFDRCYDARDRWRGASTNEKESVMTQQVRQTETQKLRMSLSGHHPSWWRLGNRN